MSTSQDLVKEKLLRYDEDVRLLAEAALEISQTKSQKAVAEVLESVVKKICLDGVGK